MLQLNLTNNTSAFINNTKNDACVLNTLQTTLTAGYGLVFLFGVLGNTLVVLIFGPNWRKGPIIDLLILYLAFFDFLSSIFGPFVFLYWIVTCGKTWHFGEIGCKILPALSRIFTDISIGIILIMAIDRCRAIITPLKSRFPRHIIHIAVAITVALSVLFQVYYITALQLKNGICTVMKVTAPAYAYPLVIITTTRVVAFVGIFSITTVLVVIKLRRSAVVKKLITSESLKRTHEKTTQVMKMLVTMAIIFAVTVMPRDILHLIYTVSWMGEADGITPKSLKLPNDVLKLLQVSNSIYNVFIYGKMHAHFWENVQIVILRKKRKRQYSRRTIRRRPSTRDE